jgi:DNA ligase-1
MKNKLWHPMLAAKPKDKGFGLNPAIDAAVAALPLPLLGSIKLDGIRCTVQNGKLYSRSLKPIPNLSLQEQWGFDELNGLDGEITVGCPWAADVFNRTTSVVMSRDKADDSAVFRVFDRLGRDGSCGFDKRLGEAKKVVARFHNTRGLEIVEHLWLRTLKEVSAYEKKITGVGYEGIMLRDPWGVYKHGRSTLVEGGLVAVKRFVDAEAVVLSVFEMLENTNEKQTDELGRSKRGHAQAGMVGKKTLGGFTVQLLGPNGGKGATFNIGTGIGLTADYRHKLWAKRKTLKDSVVKLRYQAVGSIDAPRLPIWLGFRSKEDM